MKRSDKGNTHEKRKSLPWRTKEGGPLPSPFLAPPNRHSDNGLNPVVARDQCNIVEHPARCRGY